MAKKSHRKIWIFTLCAALLTIVLNIAAWCSTAFSDWYIAHIFPLWVGTLGRFMGLFPISVGEWLIVAAVVPVAIAVLLLPVCAGIMLEILIGRRKRSDSYVIRTTSSEREPAGCDDKEADAGPETGRETFRRRTRVIRGYYRVFCAILAAVLLEMTLNCFILYHGSTFSEQYFGVAERKYSAEELYTLRNYVAQKANELAVTFERDERGFIVWTGDASGDADEAAASRGEEGQTRGNEVKRLRGSDYNVLGDTAVKLMEQLGKTYKRLDGYLPRPKPMFFSDFMCQQYMQGYFFPFSMEANFNQVMCLMNVPATMCHELAHLKGYIFEDEANFIGYLACEQSESDLFRYSGYLSVLPYLENDLAKMKRTAPETYERITAENPPVRLLHEVYVDETFVTEEDWERINRDALIDTEVVEQASDAFVDTTLKVNGVKDGMISYSRVVGLLLQYYEAVGYP